MSHTYGVVAKNRARRLIAGTIASGIAAVSAIGGLAGFIELAYEGAPPWVVAPGIALSAVVLITGGVATEWMHELYKEVRKLRIEQQESATILNRFPNESEFTLEMSSIYTDRTWPDSEKQAASIDETQRVQMMNLYRILQNAHSRASVKFADASARIDKAKSWSELFRISSQFSEVNNLMHRVHEGYHYLTKKCLQSKPSKLSSSDWSRAIRRITSGEGTRFAMEAISSLNRYGDLTNDDYDRLHIAISCMESQIGHRAKTPSVQRQLVLDFELIEFEIQVYGSMNLIGAYFKESPLFLSNRPV